MPNPNRPANVTSIAPGATVATLMAASIRHQGVITRYIDTNTGRRAACNQWLSPESAVTTGADLGLRIRLVTKAAMLMATATHNAV